ncbi:hypothetical protein CMI37_12235 [Candidatus Pacearchaeota archaeon]|nr:hypothetical protein [Candidatus Pacearchaeota archaeon]
MKLRLTLYDSGKRRVLLNWDNVTLVKPTSSYTDIEYTEICLVGGKSVGVEESLEDIELILTANENSKKR